MHSLIFILTESMAINLYLAKKYGGPLAPKDAIEDAKFTQWAFWVMLEVEKDALGMLFGKMQKKDAAIHAQALSKQMPIIETALSGKEYLVGDRFTVADLNTASVINWALVGGFDFTPFPFTAKWLAVCNARKQGARL